MRRVHDRHSHQRMISNWGKRIHNLQLEKENEELIRELEEEQPDEDEEDN